MTTERAKWWRAFLPKKKSAGAKEGSSSNHFEPDFDPFREPNPASAPEHGSTQQESGSNSTISSNDTYDDSKLDSVFNEHTCRRNLKVSRSGRFREKGKKRANLPIQYNETENTTPGKEEIP